ncbi:MAG: uracil-DNA glycosylase [Gammaproteobacteria bacterium]|nr:uracil-DNA glycosylase [Gammaproteobacteria bacterium]
MRQRTVRRAAPGIRTDPVARREQYLEAMGVATWVRRRPVAPLPPVTATPASGGAEALDWEDLAAAVRACERCGLARSRTRTVFGVGNLRAELLVVGEAPGADEDAQGEPFVGRAGQLLNAMLRALGAPRETVYIANILKCRPPGNRDPAPEEVACCRPFLQRQIDLLAPRVMLAVGRIAAQNLLATDTPIGKLRGRLHEFGVARIPLVVTYHPAYLLRSPGEKRKAWSDLKFVRRELRRRRTHSGSGPAGS